MRRLPIYFLIDVSESMVGEPIKQLERALTEIIGKLRQDPQALETAYVSIIAFAGKAKTLTPLVDLATFYLPQIPIGSGTSLGAGLEQLCDDIEANVQKTTAQKKGDWKPIVFLITDGKPTDNPIAGINRWKAISQHDDSLIVITLGKNADMQVLSKLTPHLLSIDRLDDSTINSFTNWLSASVSTHSQMLVEKSACLGVSLAKNDNNLLVVDDPDEFIVSDPDFVIIAAKCSQSMLPYLIKYSRPDMTGFEEFLNKQQQFQMHGVYALDARYEEMSLPSASNEKVNTRFLSGACGCPHCGNLFGFAMCRCGGIMCIDASGDAVCPHCDTVLQFDMSSDASSNFDVTRGRG